MKETTLEEAKVLADRLSDEDWQELRDYLARWPRRRVHPPPEGVVRDKQDCEARH